MTEDIFKLRDLCEYITVGFVGSMSKLFVKEGVPLLRGQNIKPYQLNLENLKFIPREIHEKWKKSALKAGDVVIVRVGYPGTACVIPEGLGELNAASLVIVRPKSSQLNSHYLCYVINSPWGKATIKGRLVGVAQQVFNTNTAAELELPVPSISMQRKIAAILSAYDDLIENNLGRIKILEEMAQNLYREWFVKFRFPGHQKVKMVDSPLGKIPEDGWKIKRLQNLVETQYGYTASTQEEPIGPKFLRGMDINKQTFIDWAMVPYCEIEDEEYEKFKLYIGDIVVIRMADPGKVGMVEKEIEGIFASYLVRLRISSQALTPYFLFYFLLSDRYQGYIAGASTGTTRKSASAGVLVGIDMVLPPKPLLDRFESLILPIRKLIVSLIDNNTNLRRTRDLLLPKIISGELDISELDIETNNERLQN